MSAASSGAACATTPGQRWGRAAGSVLMAFAAALSPSLVCTVPMAVCATFLMIGAITGWCPTQLFKGRGTRSTRRSPNTLGFPEAPHALDTTARETAEITETTDAAGNTTTDRVGTGSRH